MYSPPCLCDNTEMVFGSSRDSTNYWSQYTHDLHVFTAWKMSLLLIRQLMDVLHNCSGCDGEKKNFGDCMETDPDSPLCIFFFLQYFTSASFSNVFASFYETNFPTHSHFHLYLPLLFFLFIYKNFLAITSPVILKTHTLIYLQFWLLVLVFSLSPSFCYFNS